MQKGTRTPEGESQPSQAASLRTGQEGERTEAPDRSLGSEASRRGENRGPNEDEDAERLRRDADAGSGS